MPVTVTGSCWYGEYDDADSRTPTSVTMNVPAGSRKEVFSYVDNDYDDGYSVWNLSYTFQGVTVSNSGDYD